MKGTLLSLHARPEEQGRVLGNNQSLQVGAEGISALLGGLLAAIFVKLSLIVLGLVAIAGAFTLYLQEQKQKN